MAELVDSQQRIIEVRPFIVRETHAESGRPIAEQIGLFMEKYLCSLPDDRKVLLSRYRVLDVARKVVGVGSVGTRCWVALMQGKEIDDPLFLQIREAQPSVLAPYSGATAYANNGQRVVVGQRIIQGAPDIFLGWGEGDGRHFYVRQLRDMKGGAELDPKITPVETLPEYGGLCGWALRWLTPSLETPPCSQGTWVRAALWTRLLPASLYLTPTKRSETTKCSPPQRARAGFRSQPSSNRLGTQASLRAGFPACRTARRYACAPRGGSRFS